MNNPTTNDQRDADILLVIIKRLLALLLVAIVVIALVSIFMGCTTPRAVEEHHHHHYEADTMAVKAQVDSHLQSWHQQIDSAWSERISQYTSQFSSQSDEREVTNEIITTATDSLGRVIRQEQRTISRSMVNSQWSMVNSLTREYESRLHYAVDSLDSVWQQRYDSLKTHWEQTDSASVQKTPVSQDNRPWYRKLWDRLQWLIIGAVVAAAAWFSRRWWSKKVTG